MKGMDTSSKFCLAARPWLQNYRAFGALLIDHFSITPRPPMAGHTREVLIACPVAPEI